MDTGRRLAWARAFLVITVVLLAPFGPGPRAQEDDQSEAVAGRAEAAMNQGLDSLRRGHLEDAVGQLTEATDLYAKAGAPAARTRALLRLAEAQQALGEYPAAARALRAALSLAEGAADRPMVASLLGSLGNVYVALGAPDEAERYLLRSAALTRELDDPTLAAAALNNLGNHYATQGSYTEALRAYGDSAVFAEKTDSSELSARAFANAARAALLDGDIAGSRSLADRSREHLQEVQPSHQTAYLLINLAQTYRRLGLQLEDERASLLLRAHQLLTRAVDIAAELGDSRAAAYALGYAGELYEEEGRHAEALQLTRRALFQAQQVEAEEPLFLMHWQMGRLFVAQGENDVAIGEYQRAVRILQKLRHRMSAEYGRPHSPFRESAGSVYFELVDLLLQSAAEGSDPSRAEALLRSARDTVELLKVAELRDYFQDTCVDALQAKVKGIEEVSRSALIVYPILLRDRIELLLSLPTGRMTRYSTPVALEVVTREVREFRMLLEKRTTFEFLPHAQQLYRWLIEPFEAELASSQVDTLVFVPDGPLRTIPMSALHDGERFLVEKYAVAITPGLDLTDPRPLDREGMKLLLAGLTESVAGSAPLQHVRRELEAIQGLYGGELLLDERFQLDAVREELSDERYNVLHIATHGEFSRDSRKSFLLTYDGRLTMDQLQDYVGLFRFRDTPLELITLSACETAAGDERAALGLSGVALKAGARSLVGTLWKVQDAAASELMIEFYRQLQGSEVSRAVALGRAQRKLMADLRYRHPGYWSAFLLISTWL